MADYNRFELSDANLTTGISPRADVQIGAAEKIFLTDEAFEFDTISSAQTLADWVSAITAKTLFPLPLVEEFSNESEEDTYYTSPITSLRTFVREGKHGFKYMIKFNPALHARLRAGINGKTMRLIQVDAVNNVIGTKDVLKFKGWSSGTLRVEKWKPSDGSNLSFTIITFMSESAFETNENIATFKVDWNIKGLNGVQQAAIEVVGTPTATEIIVDVLNNEDGSAIEGLTLPAEFELLKASDSSAQTISSVTESTTIPGRYTLAGTALVTGTINLADVVTVGSEYYEGIAATVTIA
jgi:hypothetical protein